jgi:murein DD-endopeptidase MepM/ murein hydrolase activator NlpD
MQISNPVPGTNKLNNSRPYKADSGLDICCKYGTPVVACADGKIIYSEWGHTPWKKYPDTPGSVLLEFGTPFIHKGKEYYYAWYTHLSELAFNIPDGGRTFPVKEGTMLGKTGNGNSVAHLHFGILSNRQQNDGDFIDPMELEEIVYSSNKDKIKEVKPVAEVTKVKIFIHPDKETGENKVQVFVNDKPVAAQVELTIKF